jgi:hypothetical protein
MRTPTITFLTTLLLASLAALQSTEPVTLILWPLKSVWK